MMVPGLSTLSDVIQVLKLLGDDLEFDNSSISFLKARHTQNLRGHSIKLY